MCQDEAGRGLKMTRFATAESQCTMIRGTISGMKFYTATLMRVVLRHQKGMENEESGKRRKTRPHT